MRVGPALVLGLAAALACARQPPIADQDLLLRVIPGAGEVELGQPFPLTVMRVWRRDLVPVDWSDQALSPLVARLVSCARREDDRHVEETRHYQCQAFSLADVTLPALPFKARARDGGTERVASSDSFTLRVKPSLAREAPGPAEPPGDLLQEPFPWRLWSLRGALAVVAFAMLLVALRRRRPLVPAAAPPSAPAVTPHARARARLQRLLAQEPDGSAAIEAYYVEVSALVRDYLEERFAVRAPEMTTQEFLAAHETMRALEASHRAMLGDFLARCDLVKFASLVPEAEDRKRVLAAAERFLLETDSFAVTPPPRSRSAVL
jgi:hypothetical protein